jgi:hypothetical protein
MTEGEQRMSKALEKAHWKIKELEAEVLEQCRINGMGAERETALMTKVERLERENAELRNATLEEAAVKCEKEAAKFPTYGIGSEDSEISYIEIIRSMKS